MKNAQAPFPASQPRHHLPEGAWDAHLHMLGGPEHPLWEKRSENPAEGIDFDGWLSRLDAHLSALGCSQALIVHSIFYGTDNSVTLDSLKALGPRYKGVGLLSDGAGPAEIKPLADAGVKALRLNYVHGGVLSWEGAKAMAPALADAGLHIQMLLHCDKHIDALADDIRALPVPLVIDHCGWPTDFSRNINGLDTLCALLAEGHIYIKLSAPYRLPATNAQIAPLMRRLIDANPERCLWGSDWPHIMLNGAGMPRAAELADAVCDISNLAEQELIFRDNPNRLFLEF